MTGAGRRQTRGAQSAAEQRRMASVGRLDEGNPARPYLALHMIPYLATRGSLRRCAGGGPRARIDGKGRAFRLEMHFRLPRAADTVGSRLRRPTILS